jgi:hypothetical protein
VTLKGREYIRIFYQNIHISEKSNRFHVISWLEAPTLMAWNLFGIWKVGERNSAISEQSTLTSPEIGS